MQSNCLRKKKDVAVIEEFLPFPQPHTFTSPCGTHFQPIHFSTQKEHTTIVVPLLQTYHLYCLSNLLIFGLLFCREMGIMKLFASAPELPVLSVSYQALRVVNSMLACILMFLTGSLFALGIFTVPIESGAYPSGSLDGVWTSTIGFISLFSAPVSVFAGFYLDGGAIPSSMSSSVNSFGNCKTHRIRILCLVISLSFACLSFVAYGVQTTNALLIRISATLLSFPLGIIYLLANEILMAWNPSRPGLTTGLGQMALSSGSILISSFYSQLLSTRGTIQTFYLIAIFFSLISSLPTFLIRWPDHNYIAISSQDSISSESLEECRLVMTQNIRLPWRTLNRLRIFWMFLFIVFTSAVPYALLACFFKIGHVFGASSSQILRYFQSCTILSSCVSVFLIFLTDFVRFGSRYFSSGAKNVLTIMFTLQSILFATLIPISMASNFTMFAVVVTVLLVMMTSYSGCAAILVRDVFGSANSMVVFGIGAGVGQGSGEGLSTELMYIVEALQSNASKSPLTPQSYIPFYLVAALWSMLGLALLLCIGRCKEAFQVLPTTPYSSLTDIPSSSGNM